MELHEYASLDAVGLRQLIRAREVSAAEVEAVARRAIEDAHADLNALTLPLFEPALDHEPDGPLGGVPFVITVARSRGACRSRSAAAASAVPLRRSTTTS